MSQVQHFSKKEIKSRINEMFNEISHCPILTETGQVLDAFHMLLSEQK